MAEAALGLTEAEVAEIRAQFPALSQEIHGRPLVYLDNGATVHKPQAVIDALVGFYSRDNSNVHRGVHTLSQRATTAYEAARSTVARFMGAGSDDEIVFTRGTSEGINLVAYAWGKTNLKPGDRVVVTGMEHHSNIVPWQLICASTGAELVHLPFDERGVLEPAAIADRINAQTKMVAFVHVSNALGTVNPVEALVARAREVGAKVLIDGAQAIPHMPVDVAALGCDFYTFSGHKVYGPTGIGVLWGKPELLAAMPPWHGGGDMIESVSFEGSTFAAPPARFEAGTPNIAGAIALAAALDWVGAIGLDRVAAYEADLVAHGMAVLDGIDGVRSIGTAPGKAGLLSFVIEGVHAHDAGMLLDEQGIAVRVGHHCAEPAMKAFGVSATIRASLAVYNTRAELTQLGEALKKVIRLFG